MKARCKSRCKEASDVLTHRQKASRGRSKLDDLNRANIRYREDEEPDQDIRLVTRELSSLVETQMRHYKEWLGGIDQVVSRVAVNADIPCVHEACCFDLVYLAVGRRRMF